MRRFVLLSILGVLSLGASASLREPMNGKFGLDKVLVNKNRDVRLDSIRTLGEWGGWVDSMSYFRYDAKGRLIAAEGYDGNHKNVSRVRIEYGKGESFTLREVTADDDNAHSHEYTYKYDRDGRLVSMTNECFHKNFVQHTEISYKERNGVVTRTYRSTDGGENVVAVYNADGKLLSADLPDRRVSWRYDASGNLLDIKLTKDGKESYLNRNYYDFDRKNRVSKATMISYKDGVADTSIVTYSYNDDDQVIRRSSGSSFVDYTYTNFGDIIMETSIDNGNIYGAKNKTYFYTVKEQPLAKNKQKYDMSIYPVGSPVANYGKLCLRNSQLCDSKGNPVQLRGMSTHGVQWFTHIYTDPKAISTLVEKWNISVLRVAMYVQESGYATNAVKSDLEWNYYIDSISSLCAQMGIYCIIDWHVLNPGDPMADANYNKAMQFWDYMSKKHAGDAHVLYEICNEPNGGDVSWPRVREYGRHIMRTIRKNDPNTVVLVGTPVWSQDIDVAAVAQIEDPSVMYTLHFYSGSHGESFRMRGERALSAPYKAPIFISEFGTSDASGDNGFFKETTLDWLAWANKNMLSWCNWSFADKGESASALQSGAASTGFSSLTESGALIRSILLDPTSVKTAEGSEVQQQNN